MMVVQGKPTKTQDFVMARQP